jgi:alpha-1,6-mannosyltransferase
MRIVRVTNFYGSPSAAPPSTIRELGAGYTRAGHEFVVISPGAMSSRRSTSYGTVITVPWRLIPGRRPSLVPLVAAVTQLLNEIRPDRLEVADRLTLRTLGAWATAHGVPAVAVLDDAPAPWVLRAVGSAGYPQVVAVSVQGAVDATAHTLPTVTTVPPGVDLEQFTPLRWAGDVNRDLRDGAEVAVVLAAGPDSPGDTGVVTAAMRELLRRGIDAQLVVLENGLAVRDRAIVLASADVFVGYGDPATVVFDTLEALASGTPAVALEGTSPAGLLGGHAGAIAGAGASGLADAVARVLDLRVEDRRSAARVCAAAYPWSAVVADMLALHTNLDESPRPELAVPIG